MSKKSFSLIAVLSVAFFAACQPNPTPINSTYHKPENANVHRTQENQNASSQPETGANGSVHSTANREPMSNTQITNTQTNHSENSHK